MIKTLQLKFGRGPGLPPETIRTTPVTVFVGPNNSGKSKVLAEIYQYCISGNRNATNVIVDRLGFKGFTVDTAEERVRQVMLAPQMNETLQPEHIIVGKRGHRLQVQKAQLIAGLLEPDTQRVCPRN